MLNSRQLQCIALIKHADHLPKTHKDLANFLGISIRTFQNWLNDPEFYTHYQRATEASFVSFKREAFYALTQKVREGNMQAIKLYFKLLEDHFDADLELQSMLDAQPLATTPEAQPEYRHQQINGVDTLPRSITPADECRLPDPEIMHEYLSQQEEHLSEGRTASVKRICPEFKPLLPHLKEEISLIQTLNQANLNLKTQQSQDIPKREYPWLAPTLAQSLGIHPITTGNTQHTNGKTPLLNTNPSTQPSQR